MIWLVPLETKIYMELAMEAGFAFNSLKALRNESAPEGVMTEWPKLNPHSQLVMD